MTSTIRTLVGTARVPFLLLAPLCGGLGLAAAGWGGHAVGRAEAIAVLVGSVAAHASVNLFNEWFDFRSGLDLLTSRTPFSGGSGALPAHPAAAPAVLAAAVTTLALTALIGLWLLARHGDALLPLGLAGLVLVVAYTPWITHRPLLCLLAPGIGFGPLMVIGGAAAASGQWPLAAAVASLVPLGLVSGLLLLNQFPDVDADRAVGRRHLPMIWGRPRAARVFAALVAFSVAAVPVGVAAGALPPGTLLALLLTPLAWGVAVGALRHADDLTALRPVMGRNVVLCLAMPALMIAGGAVFGG